MNLLDKMKHIGEELLFADATKPNMPSASNTTPSTAPTAQEIVATGSPFPPAQPALATTAQTEMMTEMVNDLQNAVQARTTAYTTFAQGLKVQESAIPDTRMRYTVVANFMKSSGLDAAKLIGAIQVHKADLDTEQQKFASNIQSKRDTAVAKPTQAIQGLLEQQQRDEDQIRQIQENMHAREDTIRAKQQEIAAAEASITNVETTFNLALTAVQVYLDQEANNVRTYLQ